MKPKKEFFAPLCFLTAAFIIFFWPMLFQGKGYYYGDYRLQFFPWAKVLSDALKTGRLPLWTHQIGCGFPLLAEGQSAPLYPPNWILSLALPFPLSYHAGFLVLFAVSGAFVWALGRRRGLSPWASAFAAFLFLFGSGYAGLFYGVMALRTLAWFPCAVFCLERLMASPSPRRAAMFSVPAALMFLGGYPQMAFYAVIALAVHAALRGSDAPPKGRAMLYAAGAVGLGLMLAACQILPTLELVLGSNRAASSLDFALQKSLNPLNVFTLVWPGFGHFLGFYFYLGLIPFILSLMTLSRLKTDSSVRLGWTMTALFFLLSLGGFNPLYVLFLKWTRFYFFRVPSKFLFFSLFYLSLLAGKGLDLLEMPEGEKLFKKTAIGTFAVSVSVFAVASLTARLLHEPILRWAEAYVRSHVVGKAGHAQTAAAYLARLPVLYQGLLERTSPHHVTVWAMGIVWFLVGVLLFQGKHLGRRGRLFFIVVVSVADLFFFCFFFDGVPRQPRLR